MPRYGNGAPEGDDANRSRLFGNRNGNPYSPQGGGHAAASSGSSRSGGYGGAPSSYGSGTGYGSSYQHPQRSQYQDDGQPGASRSQVSDDETENIKGEIREVKYKTKKSTANALKIAAQTEETGSAILDSLRGQGDRLTNTEQNLGTAEIQNHIAEEKTRELQHANRGLFSPNLKGLFHSKGRARDEEARIIARNRHEREERDRTRAFGYDSKNVIGRGINTTAERAESEREPSDPERSRHQFEPDSDDDRAEDEINSDLNQLVAVTARLKGIAIASGKVVDRQNEQINRITEKSDHVDDQISLNQRRLRKF
ncbi:unnamed protein product [Tuber aestivum]|uniref:t-SNARE coiled-coil homology domain-containing protein n=1 Tax=Tuber aestivum TaxID=59557 RepID=A0A292Q0L3_9PEZI|nr:unnamed protein product [Tuber aestivum]